MTASNGAERAEHAPRDGALTREKRLERWTEAVSAFEALAWIC
jgi:hypothetical protein